MQTIALYSLKGGVGKTTAAVHVAHAAAQDGLRTLLIDLDPQGSASYALRVRGHARNSTALLESGALTEAIRESDYRGLDVLPAHLAHRRLDRMLLEHKRSKHRLKRMLKPLAASYDLVVLDCPGSLTLLAEAVFRAAGPILVPVIPSPLSASSLERLYGFFEDKGLDPGRLHPFFSMTCARRTVHRIVIESVSAAYPGTLAAQVPSRSAIERMGLERAPVACYAPKTDAARAFAALWTEVRERVLGLPPAAAPTTPSTARSRVRSRPRPRSAARRGVRR